VLTEKAKEEPVASSKDDDFMLGDPIEIEIKSESATEYEIDAEAEGYEDMYCTRLMEDLYDWGLSAQTIEEVRDVFGWCGLEALWNGR
jgi:hypothetical protein